MLAVQERQLVIPENIVELATEIEAAEVGNDAAFRYLVDRAGKTALSTSTTLPIGSWQLRLEAVGSAMQLGTQFDDMSLLTAYQWMAIYEVVISQNSDSTPGSDSEPWS
jgi:hypothetical protein